MTPGRWEIPVCVCTCVYMHVYMQNVHIFKYMQPNLRPTVLCSSPTTTLSSTLPKRQHVF